MIDGITLSCTNKCSGTGPFRMDWIVCVKEYGQLVCLDMLSALNGRLRRLIAIGTMDDKDQGMQGKVSHSQERHGDVPGTQMQATLMKTIQTDRLSKLRTAAATL